MTKRHKPPVETKVIRIHRAIAEDLDRLRDGSYTKLSYNDVIYLLLKDADAVKRKQICSSWIKYGTQQELKHIMRYLNKLWCERYPDEEYPVLLGNAEK